MTGRPVPLSDVDVDRALGRWFAGGPETLPSTAVQAALDEIVTTGQQRPLRDLVRSPGTRGWRPAALTAGVALTILVAVTLAIDPAIVGISPTATPGATRPTAPSATPVPSTSRLPRTGSIVSSADDGFQILLPGDWTETEAPIAGAHRYLEAGVDRSMTVSFGSVTPGGGRVSACSVATPGFSACAELTVAEDPADPLIGAAALLGFLDRCNGDCPVARSDTTLGGPYDAVRFELGIADRRLTYVYSTYEHQPVLVSWDQAAATADPIRVDVIRAGFEYTVPPTPTPRIVPTDLVTYRNQAWGYTIDLPGSWLGDTMPSDVIRLSSLTILAGTLDGHLRTCAIDPWPCQDAPITTLDELELAVRSAPSRLAMPTGEDHIETMLGGEPARAERVRTGGYLAGPPVYYSVFTMHNGRPFVIAFDHWAIKDGDLPSDVADAIIASVRFLD